jgi:hypothetical protein
MTSFLRIAGIAGRARTRVLTMPLMASSRPRHGRGNKHWPLLGFGAGGVAIAAVTVAFAIGIGQAAGDRACAAIVPAAVARQAGQAQPAGAVSGIATHYVLQGLPNCSYPSPPADGLFVAMPPDEYASAAGCGGYLEVHGPDGSVRVEVIDQCPDCGAGHIDLSEAAFSALAPLNAGLIDVTYQHVASPPLPGPVSLRVKEGSSQYWLALLAMSTGNPLASVQVEGESGGGWHDLVRASYNYWVAQSGAGTGPFTVRLTDTAGHVITVHGITLSPGVVQDTGTWMYSAGTPTVPEPAPAAPTPAAFRSATASRPRQQSCHPAAPGRARVGQLTGCPTAGSGACGRSVHPSCHRPVLLRN